MVTKKSWPTIILDFARNILAILGTIYIVFLIWNYSWIIALIAAIPVYILNLNLVGFMTLPLYKLTPEAKMVTKVFNASENGDMRSFMRLINKFNKGDYKVSDDNDKTTGNQSRREPNRLPFFLCDLAIPISCPPDSAVCG